MGLLWLLYQLPEVNYKNKRTKITTAYIYTKANPPKNRIFNGKIDLYQYQNQTNWHIDIPKWPDPFILVYKKQTKNTRLIEKIKQEQKSDQYSIKQNGLGFRYTTMRAMSAAESGMGIFTEYPPPPINHL